MLRGEEKVDESDSMLEVELLRELFADQHLLRTNLSLTLSLATLKLNSVTLRTGCAMPASVEIWFLGFLLISSTGHQLPVLICDNWFQFCLHVPTSRLVLVTIKSQLLLSAAPGVD